MLKNQSKIIFELINFNCDYKEISEILKLNYSDAWNKNDLVFNGINNAKMPNSTWQFHVALKKNDNLKFELNKLLDLMNAKKHELHKIYKEYNAEAQIAIMGYDYSNFGIWLSFNIIEKIYKLKAALDIDIYHLN